MNEPPRPIKSRDLSFPTDVSKLRESAPPKAPPPPAEEPPKEPPPPAEDLHFRWREMMDAVGEQPRNPDVLVRAGQLAEQMGRKLEVYTYYRKAFDIDPSRSNLIPKLRQYAPTPKEDEEVVRLARRPTTFARALDDVFIYPFRGSGAGILILGAIFIFGCRILAGYNIIPLVGTAVMVIAGAFLMMFYVDVCGTTANGSDDLPEWPDPTRFSGFMIDWAKIWLAGAVAFLPVIVLCILVIPVLMATAPEPEMEDFGPSLRPGAPVPAPAVPDDEDKGAYLADPVLAPARAGAKAALGVLVAFAAGCLVFGAAGLIYWPMAILANIVYGNPLACINPAFIFRSIRAAPKNYAICVLGFFGTVAIAGVLEAVSAAAGIFAFSGLLVTLIEIYAGAVQMRILGVFYRMNQAKLSWMTE
jgi:hypothetical protein